MPAAEPDKDLRHPLEFLLESWRENPVSPDDLEALHDQAENYIEQLHETLPLLSFPTPSCLEIDLHDQEYEYDLLQQISAHISHDMKLLENHFDTMSIWVELAMLLERSQLIETAIRTSHRLGSLQREIILLQQEIRSTLARAMNTEWDSNFAHLLESRREHILDTYESLKEQLKLYLELYQVEPLIHPFHTLTALLENLDEVLDSLSSNPN